jgi:hypothetical protein
VRSNSKSRSFTGLFALARRLLADRREGLSRLGRRDRSLIMLFALGAASSALDAVQSLTSSVSAPVQSGASATGFQQADPFEVSSPASVAVNTGAVTTGFGAASQISPVTMQALLAAQGSSTATSSAPPVAAEPSSVTAASPGLGSAAWSYHSLEQMIQRQEQALLFSTPPLSFSA